MVKRDEKNWQTLVYELFELFFQQVVPGSLAVLFYIQPWAGNVLASPNSMSILIFFVLAWAAGAVLGILSYNLPLYLSSPKSRPINALIVVFTLALGCSIFLMANPQYLPTETGLLHLRIILFSIGGLVFVVFVVWMSCYRSKSLNEKLSLIPFEKLIESALHNKKVNITIQGRTHFATIIMFRSVAALSLISFALPPERNWPDGVYGTLASIGFHCLLVWLVSFTLRIAIPK